MLYQGDARPTAITLLGAASKAVGNAPEDDASSTKGASSACSSPTFLLDKQPEFGETCEDDMAPDLDGIAGHAGDDGEEWQKIDLERYGPDVTATSGATAHFRPVTWLDRRYQLRGVLGECDSGAIFRATGRDGLRTDIAVKDIYCDCRAGERAVRHEWEGMTAVSCLDGCLGCHGAYADPCDAGAGLRYMLTMRVLEGGDLSALLKKRGRPLAVAEARIVALRVLTGVKSMHEVAGICHASLKPDNIGLLREGDFWSTVIFDIATWQPLDWRPSHWGTSLFQGNPAYACAEALRNGRTGERYDLALADAYSVGVTLFRLLTGELPARAPREAGNTGGTWLQRWERRLARWERCLTEQAGSYPPHLTRRMTAHGVPPAGQDLIVGLLHPREAQRTGVGAALAHPWLREVSGVGAHSQKQH